MTIESFRPVKRSHRSLSKEGWKSGFTEADPKVFDVTHLRVMCILASNRKEIRRILHQIMLV